MTGAVLFFLEKESDFYSKLCCNEWKKTKVKAKALGLETNGFRAPNGY